MLSEHFSKREMCCRCDCGECGVEPDLLSLLERIRELLGSPIYVNSGYRCKRHNKAVGGVPGSKHTKGEAADIRQKVYPNWVFHDKLLDWYEQGLLPELGGIGRYSNFVHVDIHKRRDGRLRRW